MLLRKISLFDRVVDNSVENDVDNFINIHMNQEDGNYMWKNHIKYSAYT